MSGGGKETQTTVQNNQPWSGAQPLLQSTMDQAKQLQQAGIGQQVYTGSTVIPYANQTMQGMQGLQNMASNNLSGAGFSGQMQGVMGTGGFNTPMLGGLAHITRAAMGSGDVGTQTIDQLGNQATNNPAMSGFQNAANGGLGTSSGDQGWIYHNAMQPGYSQNNLSDVASGGMLNRADPNFERVLSRASEDAANQVNMISAGAGRYGSGTHQGVLAREVGDLQANARLSQYNTERDRQVQANQLIDQQRLAGMGLGLNAANSASQIQQANQAMRMQGLQNQSGAYQTGIGQALGAAGASAGIQGQNADRRIGAATQEFNAGQQAFQNMPVAYQNAQMPFQTLMEVGSMYEDLAGRQKNDELRIFNQAQNAPWEQLARANAIAGGAGQFGSSTNTAQVPGQNPFLSALGYGSSIAGLLGSF